MGPGSLELDAMAQRALRTPSPLLLHSAVRGGRVYGCGRRTGEAMERMVLTCVNSLRLRQFLSVTRCQARERLDTSDRGIDVTVNEQPPGRTRSRVGGGRQRHNVKEDYREPPGPSAQPPVNSC